MQGIPLLTQSDLGTENYGIANAQTSMRQHLDLSLEGTLQHRWMRGHDNVKPEIAWSQFRRRFSPGFEDMLQFGVDQNLYNPNDNLHEFVNISCIRSPIKTHHSMQDGISLSIYPLAAGGTGCLPPEVQQFKTQI